MSDAKERKQACLCPHEGGNLEKIVKHSGGNDVGKKHGEGSHSNLHVPMIAETTTCKHGSSEVDRDRQMAKEEIRESQWSRKRGG